MSTEQILSIAGGITIIVGAFTSIARIIKPVIKLTKKVDDMEKTDAEIIKRLQSVEDAQRQQTKCLTAMLNHMITGNGIEHMKEIRDELIESVIDSSKK